MNISELKRRIGNKIKTNYVKRQLNLSDISIISMNCIGGVLYHDVGARFLSPTIDLFFFADDFIKFVTNLNYYLNLTPVVTMGEKYPIGTLDDIKIYFMHYSDIESALNKWEERKKRVNPDKIFVIMAEQNNFSDQSFNDFLNIPYPKILFSRNAKLKSTDVVYYPKYKELKELPNIIDQRDMYYKGSLVKAIQKAYR